MMWLIIALIIVGLVFAFYVLPFILIIRLYNRAVQRQFNIMCTELKLPNEALTIYRNGAFVYPAIHGRIGAYDFALTSEVGPSFRFTSGKARASGRQVITKLVLRVRDHSADVTISMLKKPTGTTTGFNDCFKLEGTRMVKLSAKAESSLMGVAAEYGRALFPIQIQNGSITIQTNDQVWTSRKREKIMRAIRLAEVIAGEVT